MSTRIARRRLTAAIVLSLIHATAASAGEPGADEASTQPKEVKQLQQVVVTGTHTTTRTVAESLSPIDVLTPKDLTATGSTDLSSALGKILPSLDFPRPAINDGNDALRPVTLRGLSPDDVLVLLDGKRYHTSALVNYNSGVGRGSAPVDLNSIPMSAIDHIEVLRDGAAAQYGSDAIAGVVNIVLKKGAGEGSNSITANGGVMDKGDGDQNGVDGSVGVWLGADGKGGKAPGWARLSWNYQNAMDTNRAENRDRSTTLPGAPNPSGIPYERYGDPAVKTYQALLDFGYNLTPGVELYGYINGSKRNVTSNGYYRAWDNYRNTTAIYPNGFLPQIVNHTNDVAAVLGLRGTTGNGWRWDVSADHGQNHLVFDIDHSLNINEWYSRGYTPTYFRAGRYKTKQDVVNVDLSKDLSWGFLPNPVTLAFGAQYMRDGYGIDAGDPDSYYFDPHATYSGGVYPGGSQVFPGVTPDIAGNWARHSKAAYADLETDLSSKLSAGIAARWEDYSDAGSTRSGKLSVRYQLTDSFALRGTASNGFRAPSLAQQYYSSVSTLIQNGHLAQIGTYRVSDPIAIALGAKPLGPEKSANYGLGAVWQPLEDFNATLDLYQIRIWNQILYSDQIPVSIPGSDVTGAQFFVNGATTRTRGADLILNYLWDLDRWGKLNLNTSGNYNKVKVLDISTPAFGRASAGLLTDATPRTKYVVGADWTLDAFSLHGNLTRYGAITRIGDTHEGDQRFSARWLLDLSASYLWDGFTFTVGADNLTNQYPTKVALNNQYDDRADGLQYSSLSPFGFNGRYWYAKVAYRF